MTTPPKKPIPSPNFLTAPFWEGTKRGELLVQRCLTCDTKIFYPREICPSCLDNKLEWYKTTGRGRIHTFTIVRQPANPAFQADVPYVYAIVQLDEGPRLNANIRGIDVEDVRVEVDFEDVSPAVSLPQFRPIQS